ncbi:hypothetical protein V1511DRAFT_499186 [Dipodascopsis uninucleata]
MSSTAVSERAPLMTTFQAVVRNSIKSSRIIRVRTGCITCKRRHLKCDEKKPKCNKCTKAKRTCTYHSSDYYFRTTTSYSGDVVNISGHEDEGDHQERLLQHTTTDKDDHTPTQEPLRVVPLSMEDYNAIEDVTSLPEAAIASTTLSPTAYVTAPAEPVMEISGASESESPDSQWRSHSEHDIGTSSSRVAISNLLDESSNNSEQSEGFRLQSFGPEFNFCQITGMVININHDEYKLLQNFTKRIGPWFDLFDDDKCFQRDVIRMAFYHQTIMKAVLAISAKQLALTSSNYDFKICVQYYDETLKAVRQALTSTTPESSAAAFIATVVLSAYEMLEPAAVDWRRHLRGATSQAISLGVNSHSIGALKTAFWSYARQNVVNSMLLGSSLDFNPPLWLVDINRWADEVEWTVGTAANNLIYLWGLVTNYCAQRGDDYQAMVMGAEELEDCLELWRSKLDKRFEPLWIASGYEDGITRYFYHPAEAGLSLQVYHSAKLMLALKKPPPKNVNIIQHCRVLKQTYAEDCDRIIGISLCCEDEPASLLSIHCLHAAGQLTDDPLKRMVILRLLRGVQDSCGWETRYIQEDLLRDWDTDQN